MGLLSGIATLQGFAVLLAVTARCNAGGNAVVGSISLRVSSFPYAKLTIIAALWLFAKRVFQVSTFLTLLMQIYSKKLPGESTAFIFTTWHGFALMSCE